MLSLSLQSITNWYLMDSLSDAQLQKRENYMITFLNTQNILHPDVRTEKDRDQEKEKKECHVAAPKEIPMASRRLSIPVVDLYVLLLLTWRVPDDCRWCALYGWIVVEIRSEFLRKGKWESWQKLLKKFIAHSKDSRPHKQVCYSLLFLKSSATPTHWTGFTTKLRTPL